MALLDAENVAEYLQRYANSKKQAISSYDLVMALCNGHWSVGLNRTLSDIVGELRLQGFPVGSGTCGYWWANDSASFGGTIKLLYKRAMTSLKQITKMRRVAMPDLVGQLRLPVGSEPTIPEGVYHRFRDNQSPRNSLLVEVPIELHFDAMLFLNKNQNWDQERMFTAALSLFLIQQGIESSVAAECYVQTCGGENEDP
jgi:Protein of unknown function (DUF2811)